MIFAVAVLTDPASLTLEVDRGRVEKHKLQVGEQISPPREQPLFDDILGASRRKRRAPHLFPRRQFITQKRHGAVKLMQFQRFGARYPVVAPPLLRRPVAARHAQAMKNGQVDRPLHVQAKPSVLQQHAKLLFHAEALPQTTEHQVRPDPQGRPALSVLTRVNDRQPLAEPHPRTDQCVHLATGLKLIQSSHRHQRSLPNLAAFTVVLDDLDVRIRSRRLLPEEHDQSPMLTLRIEGRDQ